MSIQELKLVSVIMPCYNAASTVKRSIESVLNQTYRFLELIIIDDFSIDSTLDVILEFKTFDNRIRVITNDSNKGVAYSRNVGLEIASGEYVAFIDSDDYWDLCKIEIQLAVMLDKHCDLSGTSYYRMDINGRNLGTVNLDNEIITYFSLLKGNVIAMSSSMVKREAIQEIRFENIGHEDYYFWLILLRNGSTGFALNFCLLYYTVRANSLSSNKIKAVSYSWDIYRNKLNLSVIRSLRYFTVHLIKSVLKRF